MSSEFNDIIRVLPESVANQIAAGEVIQRPASVIKELVENSIDAGATQIEIVIKDAGKTLIQVIDNGCGMSTVDARMAFERHATSKIRCADDLFSLHTMGFRGEALPSIAAVSELEVTSRRECDELGTRLVIRASDVELQEPAVCQKGTNIKVKNLFYNFVARRRFLKKDSIEMSHIVHEFERLALVNTDVSFKLWSNGVLLHSLPKSPLKERISALFGKIIGNNLIPVEADTSLVKLSGFIALPSAARARGHRQFMFVNGRNMRHLYFHRAVLGCYENLIAKDTQPHYFLNFEVVPDRIDVNIHPQKHEIKFEDEQPIWQILTASVRQSLGRYNASTAIEFNNFGAPDIPPIGDNSSTDGGAAVPEYNPFRLQADLPGDSRMQTRIDFPSPAYRHEGATANGYLKSKSSSTSGWDKMYEGIGRGLSQSSSDDTPKQKIITGSDEPQASGSPLIQLRNKYIITDAADGLLLIDQHRAHVNVLYSTLLAETRDGPVPTQNLMFPEALQLEPRERVMLDSSIDIIERIGYHISYNEQGDALLEGVPATIDSKNPARVLCDILIDLAETGIDVEADAIHRMLLTMARSAAITGGQTLTQPEMESLIARLFKLPTPDYTPDGHLVIYRLTDSRLAWFFQNGSSKPE